MSAWTEIVTAVRDYEAKEGYTPNTSLYMLLANEALGIISEQSEVYETSWDNSPTGDLTISGYEVLLPSNCIKPTRVEWADSDNPLKRKGLKCLDFFYPGWRDDSGEPSAYAVQGDRIVLNAANADTTGLLVVRGSAYLPDLTEEAALADNPLNYLPPRFRRLPGWYILANLPIPKREFTSHTPEAARLSEADYQRITTNRQLFTAKWEKGLAELVTIVRGRRFEPFEY